MRRYKQRFNLSSQLQQVLLALTLVVCCSVVNADNLHFSWPAGQRLAVNLSYDDALNSHLDNAISALDKYSLRGSFYLTLSNPVVMNRLAEWRAAADAGHELGNHTLYHPCRRSLKGRDWVAPHLDLDNYSLAQIQQEVLLANSMLTLIDGHTERTFTPPCGDLIASGQIYTQQLLSEFVAIKWQNRHGQKFDQVYMPHNVSGEQLIQAVKSAAKRGGALTIIFHGIGGDHLSVSSQAHETLLRYLANNKQHYWTDTYRNIMRYLNAKQSHGEGRLSD